MKKPKFRYLQKVEIKKWFYKWYWTVIAFDDVLKKYTVELNIDWSKHVFYEDELE